MGAISEYIARKLQPSELETELKKLISDYNDITGRFLFIYSSDLNKGENDISLQQDDYFIFHDLLYGLKDISKIDVYIETPGGSGETAEEIVRFLHDKFVEVNFVIAGQAKSAGTLMALSGNNIMMAETGSLGPIDAQVFIGRTVVSAHDYMEWVKEKQDEAAKNNYINPFDATIVAQINPGEIGGVDNALKFAIVLVEDWLCKYKFEHWDITETAQTPVTPQMKKERANNIATALTNHSEWRSHARSIKISDLEKLGLKITRIEENEELSKVVYKIKAVLMLLYLETSYFKIFAHGENLIKKFATNPNQDGGESK